MAVSGPPQHLDGLPVLRVLSGDSMETQALICGHSGVIHCYFVSIRSRPLSQRMLVRTGLLWAGAMFLGACATTDIDPADLPPEATVDDGIDYYSADLTAADPGAEELFNYSNNQWSTDEEGNRVYLLNGVRRGQAASYYVGDIRFLHVNDNTEGLRSNGYGGVPVYVSQRGAPLQSETFRGGRDNTYFQTRRGRVIYLPNATRPAEDGTANIDRGATTSGTRNISSGPAPSARTPSPRPTITPARPAPPAPAPRVTAPRTQPQPRTRPKDGSRRPDR